MKYGILGTGDVGQRIASKLIALGHEVKLGSRTADNAKGAAWAAANGERASLGTFADAADFGDVLFLCVSGAGALEALQAAGEEHLADKVLLDLTNPLDFSKGFPPRLSVCNDDSLGEQLQRAFPALQLVKTLNTVANPLMVEPGTLAGEHVMFVCGNSAEAKEVATALLKDQFGWRNVLDLGDLSNARGTEAYLLLWTRLYKALGTAEFNLGLVRN